MEILAFTDGACTGNPGPGGWGSIIVYTDDRVLELGGGDPSTTNNRMEIRAAIGVLNAVKGERAPVHLYTDSVYLIRGITEWIHGWRRKGWLTAEGKDVQNRDLWEQLAGLCYARGAGEKISWRWVRGHQGSPGNERCDKIAVAYAKGKSVRLYSGHLGHYQVEVLDLPPEVPLPEMKDRTEPKQAAYSYLSLVDGVVERHQTWGECERRVKGRSGARFKKATSAEDENSILAAWGVKP